ncbi:hypothetical protein AAFF_G00000360 [Aldrovandia affinis]|uniref:Uncharacterized protein n=1 Tax=Aldrovandia affinis TaxID=143900 RepID=A0AAD7TDB2_9TELE|nr:hypothetical protein AAFF_G00000360 [Aldrovandia affinis]
MTGSGLSAVPTIGGGSINKIGQWIPKNGKKSSLTQGRRPFLHSVPIGSSRHNMSDVDRKSLTLISAVKYVTRASMVEDTAAIRLHMKINTL